MDVVCGSPLRGVRLAQVKQLLAASGLDYDEGTEFTVLLEDNGEAVATASRERNVLKCVAVSPERQGEGFAATLVTELFKEALAKRIHHLFLYTKPDKRRMFADLGLYPVVETPDVLFMENVRDGMRKFVASCMEGIPESKGVAGAIVANANPFTNGHLHLVKEAAKQCARLHLFVLSEDRSEFPAMVRLRLVWEGVKEIPNVFVHPTGDYLVSSATFPSYFIKDKATVGAINYELDLTIFAHCFAQPMGITKRFVGEEPFCAVTRGYNEAMLDFLPRHGVEVAVIPRSESDGEPISASRVRALLKEQDWEGIRRLVPETTYEYLRSIRVDPMKEKDQRE